MRRYKNDDIYEMACETAYEQLYNELQRDPTDQEIEDRAEYLISNSEPDYDAIQKDDEIDFGDN